MEHVRCQLCDSDAAAALFMTRDRNWRLPGEFTLVRCRNCGFVYINPRPTVEEIGGFYPETYSSNDSETCGLAGFKIHGVHWEKTMELRAQQLLRFKSGGRLLDVGCSTGLFLVYMRSRGWDVRGVEPRADAVRAAREKFGLDVVAGYIEDAPFAPDSFDAITLNHVFEHVHDPRGLLKSIKKLLAPGGAVMIDVPNFAGLEARIFGERWIAIDAPRHLYQFTPRTLRAILEKNGFRVSEIFHGSDLGIYKLGYSESLRHLVSDLGIRKYPERAIKIEQKTASPAAFANAIHMGGRIVAIAMVDEKEMKD